LTTTTTSSVWVAAGGQVQETTIDPAALGIAVVSPAALRGGDRVHNAAVVREVLAGRGGGARDAVLLNAAAAIAAHDGLAHDRLAHDGLAHDGLAHDGLGRDALGAVQLSAATLVESLAAALVVAEQAIDSGAAAELLERWVASSHRAAR
jgi:anthranilate phosphoribosyltransferase